jgi:hypothetical protein
MSGINWTSAFEDAVCVLMDQVRNLNKALITQASVHSIKYKVFACDSKDDVIDAIGELVGTEVTCSIPDVVFDTLQTTAPWVADEDAEAGTDGYNLRINLPASARPSGGWHRVEAVITPKTQGGSADTDNAYPVVWGIETKGMIGS